MATTTQILFNSPALHSLKRDQLVKLCKIHSLKASGKNKDLIQRLKLHARTLPPNDPLSIAVRSENPDVKPVTDSEDEASDHSAGANASINTISRPSEQWEVVMDTIAEVDEETLRSNRGGSNRPAGEFGTNTSKGSVTSSLRAIATSLGLKRNTSKSDGATSSSSSLSSKDVIRSSSTLPTSDSNCDPEEPPVEPVPGQSSLQGLPAPSTARLSLSQAPATTTIRLVSNPPTNPDVLLSPPKLEPFATSFDLVPATPGGPGTSAVSVWPLSPGGVTRESLYPAVPTFQGFGDFLKQHCIRSPQYDNSDMDIDLDIPGGIEVPSIREPTPEKANTCARLNTGATPKSTEKPSAEPVDIFSPAPNPQNTSARSRSSIPRSEPFVFGSPLAQSNMSNLQFRSAAQSVLDEMNKRLAEEGVDVLNASVLNNRRTTTEESTGKEESNGPPRVTDMFEKIHQKEFDKMESITSHYAAKRGTQITASQPILSKKRKSSLMVKERQSGVQAARHRPNGSRVASGASVKILPGAFGKEEDEDDEVADRRMSKRPRVEREEPDASTQPARISIAAPPDPEEEARKQKEREAIRRRLDHNKAKRRSSMGRPSVGRAPPKAKPARLGFFATAKSLVQNVWNRGAGSKAPSNALVSRLAQPKERMNAPPKPTETKKTAFVPGSSGVPPLGSQSKRIPSGGSNMSSQSNAPGRSTLAHGNAAVSRFRKSPTPSLNPPSSSAAVDPKSSTIAGHGQSNNRNSSLVGFSSLGSRAGPSTNNTGSSSMGAKSNVRSPVANLQKAVTTVPRSRGLSTLMAPTASSLAKTNTHSRIPVSSENSIRTKGTASSKFRLAVSPPRTITLEQITNSPQSPAQATHSTKIFSQPLSPPPTGPPMSLTMAATTIVGQTTEEKSSSPKPPLLPKPKVLPGRKPRISRSKVIARLASQRAAADTGSSTSGGMAAKAGGKVRSSIGAEVAGKTIRQSYAGARGGDVMMSAKKRVRQSEHARRKSRVHFAGAEQEMDVD